VHGLNVGDLVSISRLTTTNNLKLPTRVFRVIAPVTSFTFTVLLNDLVPEDCLALGRKKIILYPAITTAEYSRVVVKKVGRAPFQFIGRAGGNQR